ncbi:MAG: DUF721 domain-containing protein [Spirochaetota bacterium]
MRKADDLIQRFLDSIGQAEGSAYIGLFKSWEPIVGERIAAHSRPVDVRGHSLVVEADHPGWVQMVMMKRNRIVGELERRFPQLGITGITVRVADRPGEHPQRDENRRPVARNAPDAAAEEHAVPPGDVPPKPKAHDEGDALDRIQDDDLRDTLSRLKKDLEQSP